MVYRQNFLGLVIDKKLPKFNRLLKYKDFFSFKIKYNKRDLTMVFQIYIEEIPPVKVLYEEFEKPT